MKFKRCYILMFLLVFLPFSFNQLEGKEHKNNTTFTKELNEFPKYKLGIGDKLIIKVHRVSSLDTTLIVLPDGNINLPRVGSLQVRNMTIDQASNAIINRYKKILKKPIVYVDLVSTRPINVLVTGEVNRPGIYSLGFDLKQQSQSAKFSNETISTQKGWPTIFDAIQKAGGIGDQADLRNIKLIRKDNKSNEFSVQNINFWNLLNNQGSTIYYPIFDGDKIEIAKAKKDNIKIRNFISNSNLSPDEISVYVTGEVKKPGNYKIKFNTKINSAIYIAGGFTNDANKKEVILIRQGLDGSSQNITYKLSNINKKNNEKLIENDIIFVKSSSLKSFTDNLSTITGPINPILNGYYFYKIFE